MKKTLFLIPARGGSKGIPNKNIKLLGGKPLIQYSIDIARKFTTDDKICVSTDSAEIKATVESCGLKVPFIRPSDLATDKSGSNEVILHAIGFYEEKGIFFDNVVLLQPTSPLRKEEQVREALKEYNESIEMLVGVKETDANPYYLLFEEDENGDLRKSKEVKGEITRRQEVPIVYEINGAIYIINIDALKKKKNITNLRKKKFLMDNFSSIDIDEMLDWYMCEMIIEKKLQR